MRTNARDHGGGVDAAIAKFGGVKDDWLDLSTGINPVAYPLPEFTHADWTMLPDKQALDRLLEAARRFWHVPEGADIVAAPGASSLIARLPTLMPSGNVEITQRTYNEHAAAFSANDWKVVSGEADARVVVHPNNPDGMLWDGRFEGSGLLVIDESFCDICPEQSHIDKACRDNTVILKSFGKFWGLAGVRLGFAIGAPELMAKLRDQLGPWPVAGPALRLGALALSDQNWAKATRARLNSDACRLDQLANSNGAMTAGGTDLFRLYQVKDAAALFQKLAEAQILTRVFPYSKQWIRFGIPAGEANWDRLKEALK